jgi:hypothetical protein
MRKIPPLGWWTMRTIDTMLRNDERTAWVGFLTSAPNFAGEPIADWIDGPDPPDVACTTSPGRKLGVELTKWVQSAQIKSGKDRQRLEQIYLGMVGSENQPRPEHLGRVHLYPKSKTVGAKDEAGFRDQLFNMLKVENAKPNPGPLDPNASIPSNYWNNVQHWNTQQGEPVSDFTGYPLLKKYLNKLWIYPRRFHHELFADGAWVGFDLPGEHYSTECMEWAAIHNIRKKIKMYQNRGIPAQHCLNEFNLICYYCDEALFHNTPTTSLGVDFSGLATGVEKALASEASVFDRIFLFHPYEAKKSMQVYGRKSN